MVEPLFPVVTFPLQVDLTHLLRYLSSHSYVTRVTEEGGQQQLWTIEPDRNAVLEITESWIDGSLDLSQDVNSDEEGKASSFGALKWVSLVNLPITWAMLILGCLGMILVYLNMFTELLFQAIDQRQWLSLSETLAKGQVWRLITPIFLHFGLLHFIFNALFIWVIGHRVEQLMGSTRYLVMILWVSVFSNFAQYMMTPNSIFGGLSGVVYGIIGFALVHQSQVEHSPLKMHTSLIVMALISLLLGVFGIIDLFMAGSVANTAHVSGLIAGALFGFYETVLRTNHPDKF